MLCYYTTIYDKTTKRNMELINRICGSKSVRHTAGGSSHESTQEHQDPGRILSFKPGTGSSLEIHIFIAYIINVLLPLFNHQYR